jgi:hypothetical protein
MVSEKKRFEILGQSENIDPSSHVEFPSGIKII